MGRARHAELFQSAAEGVGVKTEDGGRAARSVYDPTRLSQDREDMVQLNIFQGGRPNASCFPTRVGRGHPDRP